MRWSCASSSVEILRLTPTACERYPAHTCRPASGRTAVCSYTNRGGSSSAASLENRKWRREGFVARKFDRTLITIRRNTTRSPPMPDDLTTRINGRDREMNRGGRPDCSHSQMLGCRVPHPSLQSRPLIRADSLSHGGPVGPSSVLTNLARSDFGACLRLQSRLQLS